MRKVIPSSVPEASQELVAKLVKAGYLQPTLRHDPGAIAVAIARLKEHLRGGTTEAPEQHRRPPLGLAPYIAAREKKRGVDR